jgi:arylsulfatase A-like enzyme
MKAILVVFLTSIVAASAGNNVLLIIADDYGTDSSPLYNTTAGATAPTPRIAALAASGVRFSNAYACPVCSPTRATMLTGRHGFRTGVGQVVTVADGNSLTAGELTLPEVISQNNTLGIQSACFGKWHLSAGMPAATAAAPNTIGGWPHYAGSTSGALTDYFSWNKSTNGTVSTMTTYATTDLVNDATAWINARTAANQQWVAWVAFNAPHTPFHNPPAALHSYGANPATSLLKYRAAVEAMDTEIGRLLLSVNTATTDIIFIGDNGSPGQVIQPPYDNDHSKGTLYDGGTRVPLVISGPSVVSGGRTSGALVHAVDLFSTVLELAGVPLPASVTLDSESLKPVLANQSPGIRTRIYNEQFTQSDPAAGGRAIRDDRYKLIRLNNGAEEVYDLQASPAETVNLLAGGLNPVYQPFYNRLRFNLGGFSPAATPPPLSHAVGSAGFSLTVAENLAASQTMWQCTDLDFWEPVSGAVRTSAGGNVTFTAPPPLPVKCFYSILTETP